MLRNSLRFISNPIAGQDVAKAFNMIVFSLKIGNHRTIHHISEQGNEIGHLTLDAELAKPTEKQSKNGVINYEVFNSG